MNLRFCSELFCKCLFHIELAKLGFEKGLNEQNHVLLLFHVFSFESLCFDRKKRLAEMKETAKILRFGSVIPISGSDFVREVSQAPSDVWVVVILYKDGYALFYPMKYAFVYPIRHL